MLQILVLTETKNETLGVRKTCSSGMFLMNKWGFWHLFHTGHLGNPHHFRKGSHVSPVPPEVPMARHPCAVMVINCKNRRTGEGTQVKSHHLAFLLTVLSCFVSSGPLGPKLDLCTPCEYGTFFHMDQETSYMTWRALK